MKRRHWIVAFVALAVPAMADSTPAIPAGEVETAVNALFKSAPPEWQTRIHQDETQRICSETRNNPPAAEAEKILARERETMVYPADGNVLGAWENGEKIAQSGVGGQFSDGPNTVSGGNCYACHQMAPSEVNYGTLGPSLAGYGKVRGFDPGATKAAFAKVFNAQSVQPCSIMPRFGANKFLTVEQLKDVTAYLMSPDSPVNR